LRGCLPYIKVIVDALKAFDGGKSGFKIIYMILWRGIRSTCWQSRGRRYALMLKCRGRYSCDCSSRGRYSLVLSSDRRYSLGSVTRRRYSLMYSSNRRYSLGYVKRRRYSLGHNIGRRYFCRAVNSNLPGAK